MKYLLWTVEYRRTRDLCGPEQNSHLPLSTRQINLSIKVDDTFSPPLPSFRATFLASDWKTCTLSLMSAIILSTCRGRVSIYTQTLMVNFKLSSFSAFCLSLHTWGICVHFNKPSTTNWPSTSSYGRSRSGGQWYPVCWFACGRSDIRNSMCGHLHFDTRSCGKDLEQTFRNSDFFPFVLSCYEWNKIGDIDPPIENKTDFHKC